MGAKRRLALGCIAWRSAPFPVPLALEPGDCQFMKRLHTTHATHSPHLVYIVCIAVPSPLTASPPDHLSVTPPRLLICASSVSRYRTQSTYSRYAFIQSGSPRLDMQPK